MLYYNICCAIAICCRTPAEGETAAKAVNSSPQQLGLAREGSHHHSPSRQRHSRLHQVQIVAGPACRLPGCGGRPPGNLHG